MLNKNSIKLTSLLLALVLVLFPIRAFAQGEETDKSEYVSVASMIVGTCINVDDDTYENFATMREEELDMMLDD